MRGGRLASRGANSVIPVAVILTATLLIIWRVRVAIGVGPGWDTFSFLSNAAEFAGRGFGYWELHRAPVISLIVAALWRLGMPMHEATIQWVDGALTLLAVGVFYAVLRRRFNAAWSGLGALALLTVQPLWGYIGVGYTDLASVGLSLLMLLSVIAATEKNPWFYVVAALLFLCAIMTRYTAILSAFPALLWLLFRGRLLQSVKPFAAAVLAVVIAYLPAGRMYVERFGEVLFPFTIAFSMNEGVVARSGEEAVAGQAGFYLSNLAGYLVAPRIELVGWLLLAVGVSGLGLLARPMLTRAILRRYGGISVLAGVVILAGAQMVGSMPLRQLSIPVGIFLIWRGLIDPDEADGRRATAAQALDGVMLAWFLAYLDFHGHQTLQVPRYIIPMAPGILYLLLLGLRAAMADLQRTFSAENDSADSERRSAMIGVVTPIALATVLAVSLTFTVVRTPDDKNRDVELAKATATEIVERSESGKVPVVYSDLWPMTAWYARIPVMPMSQHDDARSYEHELAKTGADYYVAVGDPAYGDFKTVYSDKRGSLLERVQPAGTELPRVLYLGKAWDNYLERVTGFSFYLMSEANRIAWEKNTLMDVLNAEQLSQYDAVALYGVQWRDRESGEEELRRYLEDGGSLVIDASRNIGLPYELSDTVMFGTLIRRAGVQQDARMQVAETYAEKHPEIGEILQTPFETETGDPWYGAVYGHVEGSAVDVVATVDGRPAIAVQTLGKGRIYWIGENLVWHAFLTENAAEGRLINAVFEDAVAASAASRSR